MPQLKSISQEREIAKEKKEANKEKEIGNNVNIENKREKLHQKKADKRNKPNNIVDGYINNQYRYRYPYPAVN